MKGTPDDFREAGAKYPNYRSPKRSVAARGL
jgi:hypothetical protein